MTITIEYQPLAPTRRSHTQEIATALRALVANPKSPEGVPGSFTVPAKHWSATKAAAKDVGCEIRCRSAGENMRVMLT